MTTKAADKPSSPNDNNPPDSPAPFPNPRAHVEFYETLKREADEYDSNLFKYKDDATTTLVFTGLLSVVTSIFIVSVQNQLQPDYPGQVRPDSTIAHVQTILYSSLAASLLAGSVSVLSKRWISRYSRVETRGSLVDRGRERVHKMNGMATRNFGLFLESPPLLLQASLLLLGRALSNYLFFINKAAAGVVVGFMVFGVLSYFLIISIPTLSLSRSSPPPALDRTVGFHESRRYLTSPLSSQEEVRPQKNPNDIVTFEENNTTASHIMLAIVDSSDQQPSLFKKRVDRRGFVLDSICIEWVLKMSMDPDVILVVMKFIPEIVWHAAVRSVPLEKLYNTLLGCFDGSSGRPEVIPEFRERAYFSARAFLHVATQRKCFGDEPDAVVFESISRRYQVMGSEDYKSDADLGSTLGAIDQIFCSKYDPIPWDDFSFTSSHHAWIAHIFVYRAWDALRRGEPLPDDVKEFVLYSFRMEPTPAAPVVTDCLFIIGLILGIKLHPDDLAVTDKSREKDKQINRIYDKLLEAFLNIDSTAQEIDRALEGMELIAPLSENDIARKSYKLFHVIMQAPVSHAYIQEKKWQASRLAMYGAYKWDKYLPWVDDPQDILTFLNHHFDLATRDAENQAEPIQNALRALAYAPNTVTIDALKALDVTDPSFIRGICHVYQKDDEFQLRKAALFFLPSIGDKWFNTPDPVMEPDQVKKLCADWASSLDVIEHTLDVQKASLAVFFGMINSPHWRPHIPKEKWKLLEYFSSVPDDSEPLKRCLDNPELLDAISKVENPAAIVLWLAILWLRYKELTPDVREQLETATKDVAQGPRSSDLDIYLSVMGSELKKAEAVFAKKHSTWSMDKEAMALRAKIDNLRQAKVALTALKSGD